jgi:hypothetical protein
VQGGAAVEWQEERFGRIVPWEKGLKLQFLAIWRQILLFSWRDGVGLDLQGVRTMLYFASGITQPIIHWQGQRSEVVIQRQSFFIHLAKKYKENPVHDNQ